MNVSGSTSGPISDDRVATRRAVMLGAGGAGLAVALTACSGYQSGGGTSVAQPEEVTDDPKPAGEGTDDPKPAEEATDAPAEEETDAPAEEEPAADAFAKTADIPKGGGKIFEAEKIVITQPSAGTFKCFTAVCTHAGCTVGSVSNGTINCPCHGSKFKISDGSVAGGPAGSPLAEKKISVSGDSITLA